MDFAGIEKLSLVDYDGQLACTLFTRGCNFRCPWCHNGPLVLNTEKTVITFPEVMSFLEKRARVLDAVCLTGGEPTLQKDLFETIAAIKKLGYLVKLDTNGTNPALLKKLIEARLLDFVAMDIKNSPDRYARTCGCPTVDLPKINESIACLMNGDVPYEFRTTLIREFHDEQTIRAIAHWLKGAARYRLQKYKDTENCLTHGFTPIEEETARQYQKILKETMKDVELRNY